MPYNALFEARLPNALRGTEPPLTKVGVRGFPLVDAAQALLFGTMRKKKARGAVLDLSAMGGLLASLDDVQLRAAEASAAALSVMRADPRGIEAIAAAPGDDLRAHWPEAARTVALVLAGDRGTDYALSQIAWAHMHTPVGGRLYLAGDKEKGFDRYVRMASKAFGTGETIARDGGMRVAWLTRRPGPTPDFPANNSFVHEALGQKLQIEALPGVFSAIKADRASAMFLEFLQCENLPWQGKRVLDLGCGSGILGAFAAANGAEVTLLDVDLSSVRSAELTLAKNELQGRVLHSDAGSALGEDDEFDVVLSNPPFHVGRGAILDVAAEFFAVAKRHVARRGVFFAVANDFLPYEKTAAALGWRCEVRQKANGFKILQMNPPA